MPNVKSSEQVDDALERVPERELVHIFHALESPLLGFAYQMVKNEQTAQDIVQEAFIRLQARLAEVEQPKAWLYATVRRLAIDMIRKSRKVVPFAGAGEGGEPDPTDPAPLPDAVADATERAGLIRVCLERLESRERMLVELKFIDDLSYKQIAERMELSVGNVGYSLHHALKSLEVALSKEGVTR